MPDSLQVVVCPNYIKFVATPALDKDTTVLWSLTIMNMVSDCIKATTDENGIIGIGCLEVGGDSKHSYVITHIKLSEKARKLFVERSNHAAQQAADKMDVPYTFQLVEQEE